MFTFMHALVMCGLLLVESSACADNDGHGTGDGGSETTDTQGPSSNGTADGDDGTSGGDGDTGSNDPSQPEYAPCDPVTRVGSFRVKLQPPTSTPGFTSVEGTVQHAPDPSDDYVTLDTAGDCQLIRGREYECDPPCDAVTQRCAPSLDGTGNICHPRGRNQDAGLVAITGLLTPVSMEPNASNFYSNPESLPEIGFEPGSTIVLTAAGNQVGSPDEGVDVESFELHGWGISYLEPTAEVIVEDGMPLMLQWPTPGGTATPAHVTVELSVNNHGPSESGYLTRIYCDAPDTGSVTIDGRLVAGLFADGLSGWPSIKYRRRSADSVDLSVGCVEFLVQTEVGYPVEIPGFTSCTNDEDCPEGQLCNSYLYCEPQ